MNVDATTAPPQETGADTVVVGLVDGERPPFDADDAIAGLLRRGEARTAFRRLAVAHAGDLRLIAVGLGPPDELDAERMRAAAAAALRRARELRAERVCWAAAPDADPALVAGAVEGTLLAAYRYDRYRRGGDGEPGGEGDDGENGGRGPASLVVSSPTDAGETVREAALLAGAQNAARDLQNAPANELTPEALAERAVALAGELDGVEATVEGPEAIAAHGMGAFAAVAQGSAQEPRLIVLRYEGPDARGPLLGLVGKAVTFDTGGISLKPAGKMHEMKFDMSGGAAVLEAVGALGRLRAPVRVLAVIGATENMPGGRAVKPGDIVTAADGTTIEVNNTDAEGRLVLADCLTHAVREGAERIVDVATLTGAVVVALGSTYAALISTDDDLARHVQEAGQATGELVWRLPLHRDYAKLVEGRYADLVNSPAVRKAGTITGAEFLKRFAKEVPWAHVDIAGVASDAGRPYASKGGSGFGVRLLVELARRLAAAPPR